MDWTVPSLKRSAAKTALVALSCLAGAAAGGYLLYQDYQQAGGAGVGKPMAKIERREAKVRRKAASSFAWNNVRSDEDLFKRDSVQTSANSAAAIRFSDGTLLELGENSLVVIDDITNLSLDFLKGSVVLHTAEGDKRVTVGKDGKAKFEELAIRLMKPEPLAQLFAREQEPKKIHFAWKARGEIAEGYSLQVSSNRAFRGTRVLDIPFQKGKPVFEADAQLPPGTYFWRLATQDRSLTEPGQFKVVAATVLKPIWPANAEKLVSYGDSVPVQFRWSASEEPVASGQIEHELQVARDRDFKKIVTSQPIVPVSGLATLKDLPEAEMFWRIRSRYGDMNVLSATERFTVAKAQKPTLSLLLPEEKQAVAAAPVIRLSWSSDAEGLEYLFELQTAKGKEIASGRGRNLTYAWKGPGAGLYRWRVTAFNKERNVGETPWRTFSVFEGARLVLREPTADQEILYWEKPASFAFKWDSDEWMSRHADYSYQVQLAHDVEFKAPISGPRVRVPNLPSDKLNLPAGSYFWKVVVLDGQGQTLKSSAPSRFNYNVYPALPAPVALTPQAGAVYNFAQQDKNPVLSWSEVKEGLAYELTLTATDSNRVIAQIKTDKTSYEVKNLKPADYRWSVRAIDRIKRRGLASTPAGFKVTYGDPLKSPEIVTPEVQ